MMLLSRPRTTSPVQGPATVTLPVLSALEIAAVEIGLTDGKVARERSQLSNLFILFTRIRPRPLANERLEALRAYAELASALFPRPIGDHSLRDAGFSPEQIRLVLKAIGSISAQGSHTPARRNTRNKDHATVHRE